MAITPYTKGLHDFGTGCYAYLQPDGSWGWSNAGLVADGDQCLLVDTLFDLKLTSEMLSAMRGAVRAASNIGTLVNTHSNGDHTFGNQLVSGARIIASEACAEEMRSQGPPLARGSIRREWATLGLAGAFFQEVMGRKFSAEGVVLTLPSQTFSGELEVQVGTKTVRLIEVGPAHTGGDVIAYVAADRTIFAGDILFIDGHPLVWTGPVSKWIRALDLMLGLDVETVVPGHGPVTDKAGVQRLKDYFVYLLAESRKRHAAGMDYAAAADDIRLDAFHDWLDPERLIVNVLACYREIDPALPAPSMMALREAMGRRYFSRSLEVHHAP